ncbi:MAG: uroporphyrinogen decarboxylase [Burkholderiales bacterium]|nr:uroporphyrinogen decarboxylase [Burkholderiales bacterium]
MAQLQNDVFLRALLRQPTPYTPVWIMRQAGRYLPEYNKTRSQAGSFLNLCKNPDLATEVTLQPLTRFNLDAAILFSDILTIPDAMGLGLYFADGEGPKFERPLREEKQIQSLSAIEPEEQLKYVIDAVRSIKAALGNRLPLIGFSGSPFTLACYMIEGRGGTDFHRVKKMAYERPDLFNKILEVTSTSVIAYLNAQILAGADAVMIFDTWGGSLTSKAFKQFSQNNLTQICNALTREFNGTLIPRVVFTKGGGQWLETLAETGADALGLDWSTDMAGARNRVGDRVGLQGNMDPAILLTNPDVIQREVGEVLSGFGEGSGHVFNLGHGVSQFTPPENVLALVEAVHDQSPKYHR